MLTERARRWTRIRGRNQPGKDPGLAGRQARQVSKEQARPLPLQHCHRLGFQRPQVSHSPKILNGDFQKYTIYKFIKFRITFIMIHCYGYFILLLLVGLNFFLVQIKLIFVVGEYA